MDVITTIITAIKEIFGTAGTLLDASDLNIISEEMLKFTNSSKKRRDEMKNSRNNTEDTEELDELDQ